ncbi:MAG: hypothetical protein EOO73_12865 [Myxococcales bacterium]|nr:MAG: hypothetical protein EOO73_12865 [Myxococcales bacterium]
MRAPTWALVNERRWRDEYLTLVTLRWREQGTAPTNAAPPYGDAPCCGVADIDLAIAPSR